MEVLIALILTTSFLVACVATIRQFNWWQLGIIPVVFVLAAVRVSSEGPIDLLEIIYATGLTAALLLTFINLRQLQIGIDELEYVAQLGVSLSLLTHVLMIPSAYLLLIVGFALFAIYPVLTYKRLDVASKFVYFISYASMMTFTFFTLIFTENLREITLTFTAQPFGWLAAGIFGWSLYYYFVHLVYLGHLIPGKHMGDSVSIVYQASYQYFSNMQYRAPVLICTAAASYGMVFLWEMWFDSLVNGIAVVIATVSYVGYRMRQRRHETYFFTPDSLRDV